MEQVVSVTHAAFAAVVGESTSLTNGDSIASKIVLERANIYSIVSANHTGFSITATNVSQSCTNVSARFMMIATSPL